MKRFSIIFAIMLSFAFSLTGCSKLTVEKNLIEECSNLSNVLIETFYNKPEGADLSEASAENFYIKISEDETQDLTAVTINNMIYKKDVKINFSVGNNNFLEVPIWKLKNGKLYLALPTIYSEAKGGITKIEAGKKIYSIRVYEGSGNITMGKVGAYGTIEGAMASKTSDSSGRIIVKHTRESGKTFVGWVLTQNREPLKEGLYIYTKKYYEESKKISYGIDITVNSEIKDYTSGVYNYYINGPITQPNSRTIDYTVAIPTVGNINFEIQITEKVPGNE